MRNRLLSLSLFALLSLSAVLPAVAAPPNDDHERGLLTRIAKIVRSIKRVIVPSDELIIPHP